MKWKLLLVGVGVLILVAGLAILAVKQLSPTEPLAVVNGQLKLPGLSASVTVIRDRQGVPHIFANTPADAYCALGYIHAQDRRLQMEFFRRTAKGQASLLAGETSVASDRLMLTLGLARSAEIEAARLSAEDRALLDAYARGVNAATDEMRWSGSNIARMLNVPEEKWTISDTLCIFKLVTVSYSTQYYEELIAASVLREVGGDRLSQFIPSTADDKQVPLINAPPENAVQNSFVPCPDELNCPDLLQSLAAVSSSNRFGVGSNSWVIHGDITLSGSPFLASDPHMALSAPSGIYSAHLVAPGLQVSGVGIAGTPLFLHGHNDQIAWAVTVAGTDSQDLFLEELSPQDPTLVRTSVGWSKLQTHEEQIRVRGSTAPITHTVRLSTHGPLISDANPSLIEAALTPDEKAKEKYALALSIAGLEPASPAWAFSLTRAHDWRSFRDALRTYSGSGFNFVFADKAGNIGYQLAAAIPLRKGKPPETPARGWEQDNDWRGTLQFDLLPSVLNPPDKLIVTANARISGPSYPHYLGMRWGDLPWRAQRIRSLILSKPKIDFGELDDIQLDVYQDSMSEVIKWVRLARSGNTDVASLQQSLEGWDRKATTGSIQQTLAEAFQRELLQEVFRPHLSPKLLSTYVSYPLFAWPSLQRAMNDPDASFFGAPTEVGRVRRAEAVERSITAALKQLAEKFGTDRSRWAWGKVHTLTFRSPLAQSPNVLARWLLSNRNVGPFEAGGSNTTINVAYWPLSEPFSVANGAGFRQIIDLADFSRSIYLPPPPGQSENPNSPHYRDLAASWAQGTYYPMLWTRKQIDDQTGAVLTLSP